MQIRVHAQVVDPKTNQTHTTNIFHFTISSGSGAVPQVIPKTYGGKFVIKQSVSQTVNQAVKIRPTFHFTILSGTGTVLPVISETYWGKCVIKQSVK